MPHSRILSSVISVKAVILRLVTRPSAKTCLKIFNDKSFKCLSQESDNYGYTDTGSGWNCVKIWHDRVLVEIFLWNATNPVIQVKKLKKKKNHHYWGKFCKLHKERTLCSQIVSIGLHLEILAYMYMNNILEYKM